MFKYIIIISSLFLFTSCEDVIEVDINNQDKDLFAIEAKITNLDEPRVFVTQSLSVTVDQPYLGVSNLMVTISDDSEPSTTVSLVEDNTRKGYYTVPENQDYFGQAGKTYTLLIETPEGVSITASETLYPIVACDSIQVKPSSRGDKLFLGVFTFGEETPGLGNYYKWDIYINDTLVKIDNADYLFYTSDELVDGNYISGLEIFTDFHDPNEPSERLLRFLDTVYVEQTSISEFAYNYYSQMSNQSSSGSMFSVPPANIPGNFSSSDGNKVIGLFTAHDISKSNVVIINDSIENLLNKNLKP